MNEKLTFIDLFSGLGGFRIALESLGAQCVFSSEIDLHARETYYMNFGEYPSGDITKISEKEIPEHDILCAGFPCQPFSHAGLRKGFDDARGTLFFDIIRIAKARRPKVLFLENVSGLTSHDNGKTIQVIKEQIANLGYTLYYKTMNAMHYGIPQNRNRWYGVAIRNDLVQGEFYFPPKKPLKFTLNDVIKDLNLQEYQITPIARSNIKNHLSKFKENKRYNEDNILIANEIRKSRCHFRCDGISPCLTAKMGTGGNNVPVVVSLNRKLTERECLSLMGFPNWYKVIPNKMQTYKQIGNSVVVPLVQEIAENIIKYLE